MSQPEPPSVKADQIAHKFFNKFALVVHDARATGPQLPQPRQKVDKWFNLETGETDLFREPLRPYRSLSSGSVPPPLVLSVLLVIPELNNGEVVVFSGGPGSHRTPVLPTPRRILLEQWALDFRPGSQAQAQGPPDDITLPAVYKHAIATFRALYSLLRALPAWRIHKRASRRSRNSLAIDVVVGGEPPGVLPFGAPLSATAPPVATQTHAFPPVAHPSGALAISLRYLESADFSIDALESLLSSRFLQQEAAPDPTRALEFTPTVLRHRTESQHAGSLGSSPGSLPQPQRPGMRPASALVSRSELDKFLVNRDVPSPSHGSVAFPSSAQPHQQSVGAGSSGASQQGLSPKLAMLKLDDAGSIRSRRDSAGTGGVPMERAASTDISSPSPVSFPNRRPSINAIHPFKSGTLSGSFHSPSPAASSLRQNSPLPTITASSTMSRAQPSPLTPGRPLSFPIAAPGLSSSPSSISPVGAGFGIGRPSPPLQSQNMGITRPSPPNPSTAGITRPSPPYTPSSLAERRSLGGASSSPSDPSSSVPPQQQKRFSATFSHRYSPSPANSNQQAQADDLGAFVQAIDARAPLRHAREISAGAPDERALRAGAIPTTQGEVRDQLAAMHAQFAASLEGIEQRRRTASLTEDDRDAQARADPPRRPPAPFRVPDVPPRPLLLRRDSGGSPLAGQAQSSSSGSGPVSRPPVQRRDSADARPSVLRRDSGDSPFSAQPTHGGGDAESPFRRAAIAGESDDNASDRGSLQLRWRPRLGSAGGTDSDGEKGASASDLIGGRMEL